MTRNIDLEAERLFENRKASGEDIRKAQSKFYWATSISINNHKRETLIAIQKKAVLEIGCASGYDSKFYSQAAESYVGVDISDIAIENCRKLMLPNAKFLCVDGHDLPVQDNSMDCIIVNSLLHHLDLSVVFSEIQRVLKLNGLLIFREPLGTNLAFNLYRRFTPSSRTSDERPFTFSDLQLMEQYFILDSNVKFFGFFSILSAYTRNDRIRRYLTQIDGLLSKTPLRFFFWQFCGIVKVRN